jgi:outer membrane protein OmpA-like peptidoglycan-associated protein
MLFELGNLAAGASTSFNFSYVLSQTSAADLISSTPEVARRIFPSSYVMFAQNGADTNSLPQSELLDSTKALWKNPMSRAGYTFNGWNTKADGTGTAYADGAIFKFDSPTIILYAQWKLIQTKPTITWATPTPIQEGTALSATQLNAVGSVPGTYTYSPAAAAVPAVGKQILKVTFVPTDPKYETTEATVEIEVLAKAKITWANPVSIIEGTALSPTQLNATASVPGSFVYDPKDGALLAPGKSTLKVTFTPTDSRLTAVTAEVSIEVTAKPVVIPAPPISPTYTVTGSPKTTITWGAGKDAATYTVLVDGKSACSVAALTCDVAQLLGPNNVVTVTSVALSTKTSAAITASYVAPASSQVLTVVNFDTAKAIIKAAEAAKLRAFAALVKAAGYTTLTVYGHTDSVGGIDNQKLSVARANAAITYLKKLLPGVTFERSGFAASEPVANNATTQGKASNRRAEIFIP